MKYPKNLIVAIAFALLMPIGLFAKSDSPEVYTREQVDSIVNEVKANFKQWADTELVDLKIDKAANEKIDAQLSEHDTLITHHLTIIGLIITFLAAIIGIFIPMILNREREKAVKKLEVKLLDIMRSAKKYEESAKESICHAEFAEKLARTVFNADVDIQIKNLSELITKGFASGDRSMLSNALLSRGCLYESKNSMDKAIADYTEAIMINLNDEDAYNTRGNAYGKIGDCDKAIADYTEAIRINPNYSKAYYNRGIEHVKKGDNNKAIEDYTEAIRIDLNYTEAYCNRGNEYYNKGEYSLAILDYNEAIRISPDNRDAYYNRGAAYTGKGEYEKAIADYTESIMIDPDYSAAYNNRGLAYYRLGSYNKALKDFTESIRLKPNVSIYYASRCFVYTALNQLREALDDVNKGLEIALWKGDKEIIKLLVTKKDEIEEAIKKTKEQ